MQRIFEILVASDLANELLGVVNMYPQLFSVYILFLKQYNLIRIRAQEVLMLAHIDDRSTKHMSLQRFGILLVIS